MSKKRTPDSFEARQQARLAAIDRHIREARHELAMIGRTPIQAIERRCHACRTLVDHVEDHDRFMRFDCPVHGPVLSYIDKRVLDPHGQVRSVFAAHALAITTLRHDIATLEARRAAVATEGRLFPFLSPPESTTTDRSR